MNVNTQPNPVVSPTTPTPLFYSEHAGTMDAFLFAKAAHHRVGQLRKYTNEPYIVHPVAVAYMVIQAARGDHAMAAAALLHDVVEDTGTTLDDVRDAFGDDVAQLVAEVTDISCPADGSRAIRKNRDLVHVSDASARGKTIKLADLIHNTASIVRYDPAFARVYLAEKEQLLLVLREGDPELYALAVTFLLAGAQTLGDSGLIAKALALHRLTYPN